MAGPEQAGAPHLGVLFLDSVPLSEELHIRSAATSLAFEPEIASPWMEAIMLIKAQRTGRTGIVGIAAIGLIWSVAAMSKLVPVAHAEMRSAATSPHAITVR
jgi:hypothetical protein